MALPANNKTVGDANHTADHNAIVNEIASTQASLASLTTTVSGKQTQDADLDAIAALSHANDTILQTKSGAWTARTPAQLKTDLALVKGDVGLGSVDNTSNATERAATATLTNKTLDFDFDTTGNVVDNIPQIAVDGLVDALASVGTGGLAFVVYDEAEEEYPSRSSSGTINPNVPVLWIRGDGPAISGTGSTGAVVGDLWLRAV